MLIRSIGLKASAVASYGEEGERKIEITGEDAGVLIGHHGETLDALQYIANLAANRRAPVDEDGTKKQHIKVIIDVENTEQGESSRPAANGGRVSTQEKYHPCR